MGRPSPHKGDFSFRQLFEQMRVLPVFPDIRNTRHGHAHIIKIKHRLQSEIMSHRKHCILTRKQSVGLGQPMRATDLHHPGTVIVVKKQGTLNTACCHDNTFGTYLHVAFVKRV